LFGFPVVWANPVKLVASVLNDPEKFQEAPKEKLPNVRTKAQRKKMNVFIG